MATSAAAALAAVAGLAAALLDPRGPITAADALIWMVGTMLLGLGTAVLMASRWSLILTPLAFVAAFEVARLGTPGPTVDGIHPGSTYGIIALIVGRLATYLLALLPMLLGGALGIALAARLRRQGSRPLGIPGWSLTAVTATIVGLLAVGIANPGSTAPILGVDGRPLDGSIAELTSVDLGGHEQALMIRGRRSDNPVLLHLAGGPGGTDLGAMRADSSLEDHFVVVTWEQRGAGKSYAALDPVETLTLDRMVADTIELSEHLRDRFGEERIYLTGNSWGSLLGVLAVQQRPDLYHAWIGTGQMVAPRETDIMFWEDTLAWAEDSGDEALLTALRQNGPPPYDDMLAYEPALSHEHDWNVYPEFDNARELPATLFVPENGLMDQLNGLRSFLDTFSVLYPQLQDVDFREDVPSLDVPVYVVSGAHEARGRAVLAADWFDDLRAPAKSWVEFEHSGHRPSFEEPGRFARLMADVVKATYPER